MTEVGNETCAEAYQKEVRKKKSFDNVQLALTHNTSMHEKKKNQPTNPIPLMSPFLTTNEISRSCSRFL